ncbi:MAG TPA: Rieske 2Fe-2S domain-containing protein [Bacteroidales bacterium]|nr:Rieske 2Fe-2S domain-containing protein [Bacteroidales bacterium]
MKRREFIPTAILSSVVITTLPVLASSCKKDNVTPSIQGGELTVDLSSPANSSLKQDGGYIYTNNIFVYNSGNENYLALSDICTHAGCSLNYNSGQEDLYCPCHGSVFSLTGSVVQGPARTPLPKYKVSRSGNILTIS